MTTKQQRGELMRTFARFNFECPLLCSSGNAGTLIEVLEKLHGFEGQLRTLNERACNGYPECNNGREAQDTKRYERICDDVRAIADLLGFKVQFNGDPRGGAIRFVLPSGASNNWDQETWGIYW
jgi:hypothetical protein